MLIIKRDAVIRFDGENNNHVNKAKKGVKKFERRVKCFQINITNLHSKQS